MILIIADDLTGASDTGVQYKNNGFSVMVKVCTEGDEVREYLKSYDVISINADSRPLGKEEAYETVFALIRALNGFDAEYIYKKVDSLMRGNPAPELDAVMDATGLQTALVAPSFPENGRLIEEGILTMPDGRQVDVTEIFNKETKRRAVNIPLSVVRQGTGRLLAQLLQRREDGYEIFVLDAKTDSDLEMIAGLSGMLGGCAFCGSAGLAKQLSAREAPGEQHAPKKKKHGMTLLVVGSRTKETAGQVKKASSYFNIPMVLVDTDRMTGPGSKEAVSEYVKRVLQYAEDGEQLIILALNSLFEGFSMKLRNTNGEYVKAFCIAQALGEIVRAVYEKHPFGGVVATGGDTSLHVCKALSAAGIALSDEIVAGIPVGTMVGGRAAGMTIVTKSGAFGDEDALIRVIEYLNIKKEIAL